MNNSCPYVFDPEFNLVRGEVGVAGYHSCLAAGTPVHPTRESMYAAHFFFKTGLEEDQIIALRIVDRILELQVSDPTNPHYGIWGWYAEESPEQMRPADWNWADFIGVALIEFLAAFESRLQPEMVRRILEALERATWSIFRRNIGPGYTNICAMGAFVCLAYGERTNHALLIDYGARRFHALRRLTEKNGAFGEYNSPIYSIVLLEEIERILRLVNHAAAKEDAAWMLDLSWKLISRHYHPGTGQWAGAQSRAYSDWTTDFPLSALVARLGQPLPCRQADGSVGQIKLRDTLYPVVPCPDSYLKLFTDLSSGTEFRQVWTRDEAGRPTRTGTIWLDNELTVGSVDKETTWDQSRMLVVYWKTEQDMAVRLRPRLLHNGRNFESGFMRNAQSGQRVLSGFHFINNGGDWHPHFDVPVDGVFKTRDLRVRYEAEGKGIQLRQEAEHVYVFSAGRHQAWLQVGAIRYDGQEVTRWEMGQKDDVVWVEGIFYEGVEHSFKPADSKECSAIAFLELIREGQNPSKAHFSEKVEFGKRVVTWSEDHELQIVLPLSAPTKEAAYKFI
jgi:hypothetical protein